MKRLHGLPSEEVEELEEVEVEVLDDDDVLVTGEITRPTMPRVLSSVPPPIPPEAREPRRSGSVVTGLLPPPPRYVGGEPRTRSGVFGVDPRHRQGSGASGGSERPVATVAAERVEFERRLGLHQFELEKLRAHNAQLRSTLLARDERLRELEHLLREERHRSERLDHELMRLRGEARPDDLTRIAGIGPAFARALRDVGVTSLEQIAAWTSDDIERIAPQIRTSPRRIERDGWVARAGALAHETRAGALAHETRARALAHETSEGEE